MPCAPDVPVNPGEFMFIDDANSLIRLRENLSDTKRSYAVATISACRIGLLNSQPVLGERIRYQAFPRRHSY